MKKLIHIVSALLLGSFAVTASATPIQLSTIGDFSISSANSSHLKMTANTTLIFNNLATSGFDLSTVGTRVRPTLVTQAMSMPITNAFGTMDLGAQSMSSVTTPSAPGASSGSNVLPVSEPSLLLLLAMGLFVAVVRRKY